MEGARDPKFHRGRLRQQRRDRRPTEEKQNECQNGPPEAGHWDQETIRVVPRDAMVWRSTVYSVDANGSVIGSTLSTLRSTGLS